MEKRTSQMREGPPPKKPHAGDGTFGPKGGPAEALKQDKALARAASTKNANGPSGAAGAAARGAAAKGAAGKKGAPPTPPVDELKLKEEQIQLQASQLAQAQQETVAEAFAVIGLPVSAPLQTLTPCGGDELVLANVLLVSAAEVKPEGFEVLTATPCGQKAVLSTGVPVYLAQMLKPQRQCSRPITALRLVDTERGEIVGDALGLFKGQTDAFRKSPGSRSRRARIRRNNRRDHAVAPPHAEQHARLSAGDRFRAIGGHRREGLVRELADAAWCFEPVLGSMLVAHPLGHVHNH